jgi:hypothetical protein
LGELYQGRLSPHEGRISGTGSVFSPLSADGHMPDYFVNIWVATKPTGVFGLKKSNRLMVHQEEHMSYAQES